MFIEEWRDDAAPQRHFAQPHTARFMAALVPMLAEPADALIHTTAESRRLDPERGLVVVD